MFCNKCGTKLPDGTTFCTECGAVLTSAPQAEPAPQIPEPTPAAPKQKPEIKLPANIKPILVLVTMALSLLLILLSINSALTTPFYQIPAASLLLDASGDGDEAVDELIDSIDDTIGDMEDELDFREDLLDDDEVEAVEAAIKSMKTLRNNFSIKNFQAFVDLAEDIDEEFNAGFDADEIDEIQSIMGILVTIIRAFFVLPVLFWVLGGLRKSAGLTITAIVFTTISQLIYCGILWVILSLAVGVVQVKLCKELKPKAKRNQTAA